MQAHQAHQLTIIDRCRTPRCKNFLQAMGAHVSGQAQYRVGHPRSINAQGSSHEGDGGIHQYERVGWATTRQASVQCIPVGTHHQVKATFVLPMGHLILVRRRFQKTSTR